MPGNRVLEPLVESASPTYDFTEYLDLWVCWYLELFFPAVFESRVTAWQPRECFLSACIQLNEERFSKFF